MRHPTKTSWPRQSPHDGPEILAGRYEQVAMPDYAIKLIHATLDPSLRDSYLTVNNISAYERYGKMRLSFDCPVEGQSARKSVCSARFSARLLDVSDRKFHPGANQRAFKIAANLVIGTSLVKAKLWLTELSIRSTSLVIGSDLVGVGYEIDSSRAFHLGQPRHVTMLKATQ